MTDRFRLPEFLTGTALVLLIVGAGVALKQGRSNHRADVQFAAAAQQGHTPNGQVLPSIVKPVVSAYDAYQVPSAAARYLLIPKLAVQAMVYPMRQMADGAIAAPATIYEAGWFEGSSQPGLPGATLIDGHVGVGSEPGIFANLEKLAPGDQIKIEKGNGQIIAYKVVKTQVYDADSVDMTTALSPVDSGHPGLNLMTCTGSVAPHTYEYNKRVVVYAEEDSV